MARPKPSHFIWLTQTHFTYRACVAGSACAARIRRTDYEPDGLRTRKLLGRMAGKSHNLLGSFHDDCISFES